VLHHGLLFGATFSAAGFDSVGMVGDLIFGDPAQAELDQTKSMAQRAMPNE